MKIRFPVLLLFLAPALLAGCMTVYYPVLEPATDDYYHAQDSQVARGVFYGSGSARYTDMGIYPWWSMDYFYLGYHPYSYWRSAYYRPYFYPPRHWYFHYGYSGYYAWYDPYWHHRYRHHGPSYGGGHYRGGGRLHDSNPVVGRYTGGPGSNPDLRRMLDDNSRDRETMNRGYRTTRQQESSGSQRRVTVAPSSGSSRHGMVIMSPVNQKSRPIRVDPVRSSGLSATVTPSSSIPTPAPRIAPSRSATSKRAPGRPTTSLVRAITPARSGSNHAAAVPPRSSGHSSAAHLSRNRSTPGRARFERDRN